MNNRFEIAQKFADSIKSKYIEQIILFGSVARGEDYEESDIDILIVSPIADEIKSSIHDKVIEIILEDEEVISPHLMTVEHFNRTINYPFLTNVLKDGVYL